MKNWEPELVCENEVPIQNELITHDLYNRLLQEQAQGNIAINRYQNSKDYKKHISEYIVDRLIRFDALHYLETDERFQKYYKDIIEALQSIMDGHLLAIRWQLFNPG